MKELVNTFVTNAFFALIAVIGVAFQEAAISASFLLSVIGIGAFAALGGGLLGELVKILVCKTDFNKKQYFIGSAVGLVLGVILAVILL